MEVKQSDICQYEAPAKVQELPAEVLLHCMEWSTPKEAARCAQAGDRYFSRQASSDENWEFYLRRDFKGRGRPPGTKDHRRRAVYAIIATGKWREINFSDRPIYQRILIVVGCLVLSIPLTIYLSPRIFRAFHNSCIVPAMDAWEDASNAIAPVSGGGTGGKGGKTFDYASSSWLSKSKTARGAAAAASRKHFTDRPLYQKVLISLLSIPAAPVWLVKHRRAVMAGLGQIISFWWHKLRSGGGWTSRHIVQPFKNFTRRFILAPIGGGFLWMVAKVNQVAATLKLWITTGSKFTARMFNTYVVQPTIALGKFALRCIKATYYWSQDHIVKPTTHFCAWLDKKTKELILITIDLAKKTDQFITDHFLVPVANFSLWTLEKNVDVVTTTVKFAHEKVEKPMIKFGFWAAKKIIKLNILVATKSATWADDFILTPSAKFSWWLGAKICQSIGKTFNLVSKMGWSAGGTFRHRILNPAVNWTEFILVQAWRSLCKSGELSWATLKAIDKALLHPIGHFVRWLIVKNADLCVEGIKLLHHQVILPSCAFEKWLVMKLRHLVLINLFLSWQYIIKPSFHWTRWLLGQIGVSIYLTLKFIDETIRKIYRKFKTLAFYFIDTVVLPIFAQIRKLVSVMAWIVSLLVHYVTRTVFPALVHALKKGAAFMKSLLLTLKDLLKMCAETFYRYVLSPLGTFILLLGKTIKLAVEVVATAILGTIYLVLRAFGTAATYFYEHFLTPIGHMLLTCLGAMKDAIRVLLAVLKSAVAAGLNMLNEVRKALQDAAHAAFTMIRDAIVAFIQVVTAQWTKFANWVSGNAQ